MTTEIERRRPSRERANVWVGSLWMIGITLLLFFVPLVNGFVGGLVGGYKVGSPGRATVASLLPAAVVAVGIWLLLAAFEAPLAGVFAGLAVGFAVLLSEIGLLFGAVLGGAMGSRRLARSPA